MKKIFVADKDEKFQSVMKSICEREKVDLHIYTTSMEILALIELEKPNLVFLNLGLPDMNDFVMFDLLKRADIIPPIPVLITYTTQSEEELQNYKNLKFHPQGFHKKPIKEKDLQALLAIYLGDITNTDAENFEGLDNALDNANDKGTSLVEDDDIIFNEVLAENEMEENPLESVIDESQPKKPLGAVFKVSDGDYVEVGERTDERERAARLVSLEMQNHYLMTENKRLLDEMKSLKEKSVQIEAAGKELQQKTDHNKKSYENLEKLVNELNMKLTDKERELIAKDHEFEKKLKKEMDETIRETEERIRTDIGQLYKNELNSQKESNTKLQLEINELKKIESSFNNLSDEKTALSQKINELENEKKSIMKKLMTLEVDVSNLEKEREEREKSFSSATEKSTKELEFVQEELKDSRNRIEMLGDLLQKAITLTKK